MLYILTNLVRNKFLTIIIATKLAKYDSIHIHLHDIQTLPCSTLASSNGISKHHHSLRLCKELSRRFKSTV